MGRCAGKSLALQRGRGPVPPRAARPDVGGATHVTSLAHVPGHEAEPRHGQAPGRAGQGGSAGAQGCGGTGRMRPQERRGLPASCSSTGAAAARSGRSKNAEKKRRLLKIAAGRGGAGAAPGIAAPGQEQAPLTRGIKGTCHATPAPRARGQLLPGLSHHRGHGQGELPTLLPGCEAWKRCPVPLSRGPQEETAVAGSFSGL